MYHLKEALQAKARIKGKPEKEWLSDPD